MDKVSNRYCVWSQMRDDARNLQRFIEWHLSQGFEYFVFGDDRSVDNPRSILKPYIDKGIVDLYDATEHSENQGRFVGKSFFAKDDIIAFIDVDEFLRSVSGFAKNELDKIFSDRSTDILYLNWVFKSTGNTAPSLLGDYRDSFSYTQPDIFTKYVVRGSSVQNLKLGELSCHFASGIPIEKSKNGALSQPQFIEPTEPGDIRERVRNNQFIFSKTPMTWSLYPEDPKIWLDHFYTREFDDYFNYKSILGNKQGVGTANQIRAMGYYKHGLGDPNPALTRPLNSLNFCRLYPKLQSTPNSETPNNYSNTFTKAVYIHLGLPKTGTSAFQDAIFEFMKINPQSPIGYLRISDSKYKDEARNGLDLATSAKSDNYLEFRMTMEQYLGAIKEMPQKIHLITAEEFSTLESSEYGLIVKSFNDQKLSICAIAVIRPFIDFSISFFKQYVNAHVNSSYHTLLSYEQIAESARKHVERVVLNCMLSNDFKVVDYSAQGVSSRILNFIYQESEPIDLSKIEQRVNLSLNFQIADEAFKIRRSESVNNEFKSKEYLRAHASDSPTRYQLPLNHPYHRALIGEREKLEHFISTFPHQHRWDRLFAESD
jgi:hypothetical protein